MISEQPLTTAALLQVLRDLVAQSSPRPPLLPASRTSFAASSLHQPAIIEQGLMSVPDMEDPDSTIALWVPSSPLPPSEGSQPVPDEISTVTPGQERCGVGGTLKLALPIASHSWSLQPRQHPCCSRLQHRPPSQTVTSHMVTTPAITGAHSLMKLSSSGRMSRGVSRHPGPSRNLSALTTIKRAHRSGGYTFCGRPSKVACWLSNLCEQEPALPISDSQLWALRSESDPYSPVGLAGLQQLGS